MKTATVWVQAQLSSSNSLTNLSVTSATFLYQFFANVGSFLTHGLLKGKEHLLVRPVTGFGGVHLKSWDPLSIGQRYDSLERRSAYLHVKKTICPICTSAPIPKRTAVNLKKMSAWGGSYPYMPKRCERKLRQFFMKQLWRLQTPYKMFTIHHLSRYTMYSCAAILERAGISGLVVIIKSQSDIRTMVE